MTFRGNFLITLLTRAFYFTAQVALFEIIYGAVDTVGDWSRAEYFGFMSTGLLVNALVETFFMPNLSAFSELIRTGKLDFALLKPIDTQFLVSFEKVEVAQLGQVGLALGLLGYSVTSLGLWEDLFLSPGGWMRVALYCVLVGCATAFFYSLMICLAAASVSMGRNTGLYDFWFYVTVFARYPRDIYSGGPAAALLSAAFTYVVPILLVVTTPARVAVKGTFSWPFVLACVLAAGGGLIVSRAVFRRSLRGYRSASS
jgi:ABC-2 type transport system permease protein